MQFDETVSMVFGSLLGVVERRIDVVTEISHDWNEESLEAKSLWFRTLTIEERLETFCEMMDLLLELNPEALENKLAQPIPGRVRVLELA